MGNHHRPSLRASVAESGGKARKRDQARQEQGPDLGQDPQPHSALVIAHGLLRGPGNVDRHLLEGSVRDARLVLLGGRGVLPLGRQFLSVSGQT